VRKCGYIDPPEAAFAQDMCAGVQSGSGCKNVVEDHATGLSGGDFCVNREVKGSLDPLDPFFSIGAGLRIGIDGSSQQRRDLETIRREGIEMAEDFLGLIEAPLAFFARMEWNGNDDGLLQEIHESRSTGQESGNIGCEIGPFSVFQRVEKDPCVAGEQVAAVALVEHRVQFLTVVADWILFQFTEERVAADWATGVAYEGQARNNPVRDVAVVSG